MWIHSAVTVETHNSRPLESKCGDFVLKHVIPTNTQVCLDSRMDIEIRILADMLVPSGTCIVFISQDSGVFLGRAENPAFIRCDVPF
jgi:hypothetical protein